MDNPTPTTLGQTDIALKAITTALADPDIPDDLQSALENMSNFLQGVQDGLIEQTEQAMATAFSSENEELMALNKQISDEIKKLGEVADTIKKVSQTVGTLVSIVSGLVSGGIL